MQTRRPSLETHRSVNGTTVYVRPTGNYDRTEAYVYCQLRHRSCRRDSFAHGVHTAVFNARAFVARALCLPTPAAQMPFPLQAQGRPVQSPFREFPPAMD